MTLLDFFLLAVMLISGLVAAARGLLRVSIGTACLLAATLVTMLLTQAYLFTETYFGSEISPPHLTPVTAAVNVAVFLATLIAFLILAARASRTVLNSRINPADRILGFAFGLLRGLLIVVVAFQFFIWLVPDRSQPEWVRSATSRALLTNTGQWLLSMLPDDPNDFGTAYFKKLKRERGEEVTDSPPLVVGLMVVLVLNAIEGSLLIDLLALPFRRRRILARRQDRSPKEITSNVSESRSDPLLRAEFRDLPPVQWFYAINGSHAGPVPVDGMRGLLRQGSIDQDTLVWNETFGQSWKRLRDTEIPERILRPPPLPRS